MFSTPSSLWTLETVSGSSQAVGAGQSFQPLAMRVTDGTVAANPVMGVMVTFQTTLATIGQGQGGPPGGGASATGQPVLLGSSQAQVVTSQDGIASIVPSAGNVGPCDVFVAVSAGHSAVQFQMENLAAMVPVVPVGRPRPRISSREVSVGSAEPAVVGAPVALFAVPQREVGAESAPESHASSPEHPAEELTSASAPTGTAVDEKSMSETEVRVRARSDKKKRPESQKKIAGFEAAPASVRLTPEDKRSCRALAEDGVVF
jgi:hypothetical protein